MFSCVASLYICSRCLWLVKTRHNSLIYAAILYIKTSNKIYIIPGCSRKSWHKRRARWSGTIGRYSNSSLTYFTWMSRVIRVCVGLVSLRFVIGLKKIVTLSQPIRNSTKTNRDLLGHVSPRPALARRICFEFWSTHLIVCVLWDWPKSDYFCFNWFYITLVKTILLWFVFCKISCCVKSWFTHVTQFPCSDWFITIRARAVMV